MKRYIRNICINDKKAENELFCNGFQEGFLKGASAMRPKWHNITKEKPYDIVGWTKWHNSPSYGEEYRPDDVTDYYVEDEGDLRKITPNVLVYNAGNRKFYIDYMKLFNSYNSHWIWDELEGLENNEAIWWTEMPDCPTEEDIYNLHRSDCVAVEREGKCEIVNPEED